MKKTLLIFVFILAISLLGGCGEEATEGLFVTDCLGESRTLPEHPERVVVLQASLTDLWLTAGGSVIGVTDDVADHGLDTGTAAVVGTTKNPSAEAILALKPELVIYSPDIAGQAGAAEVLKSAGIPLLPAKVDSFADYLFHLKLFSDLTGDSEAYTLFGEAVAEEIASVIDAVPEGDGPKVLFLRAYSSGVKAKAEEHVVCDILRDLGAENIAAVDHDNFIFCYDKVHG